MTLGSNLILAVLWAAIIGPFTPSNLAVGFVLGYIVLRISGGGSEPPAYARRVLATIRLGAFTILELVVANLRVAWYTVSSLR
ncbi:MAG: Na+/H+ antiporter subunit E, partial [Planctomycetota bacterium]